MGIKMIKITTPKKQYENKMIKGYEDKIINNKPIDKNIEVGFVVIEEEIINSKRVIKKVKILDISYKKENKI